MVSWTKDKNKKDVKNPTGINKEDSLEENQQNKTFHNFTDCRSSNKSNHRSLLTPSLTVMAEGQSTTDITTTKSETPSQNPPNNPFFFLSLIPKFLLKPFVNNNNKNVKVENGKSVERIDKQENSATSTVTPDAVKLPRTQAEIPPIKLENDDVQEDTNPLILWQVYALGGFIILKWAWGKWQERKNRAKNDSSGEEQPPPSAPASD